MSWSVKDTSTMWSNENVDNQFVFHEKPLNQIWSQSHQQNSRYRHILSCADQRVKSRPDSYETFHFLSTRTSDENINSKRLKKAEIWKNNLLSSQPCSQKLGDVSDDVIRDWRFFFEKEVLKTFLPSLRKIP